jgi:inhibitor of KinA
MPASIATPRLSTPRKRVPAGSVAIGGNHTGIYPVASPGGWRIIGHTAIELFRTGREPLSLLDIGDHVRFIPVR